MYGYADSAWQSVTDRNREMWSGDHFGISEGRSFYHPTDAGDRVPFEQVPLLDELLDFVRSQQELRRSTGHLSDDWVRFCASRRAGRHLYLPRGTYPLSRFGSRFAECFSGAVGLDVGCVVYPYSLKCFFDSIAEVTAVPDDSAETFIPHFLYYREFGCMIRGIDIQLPVSDSYDQAYGDLRMLQNDDATVDFFTIPMIIGPGNPASSVLDAALSLCELWRTLHPDGLIYVADFIVKPCVVLAASRLGFRVFVNKIRHEDMPTGLFLTRSEMSLKRSRFRRVMEFLRPFELVLPLDRSARITNRDLLCMDSLQPRVLTDDGQNEVS